MDTPIDGDYGLDYQIFIMRRMVEQLPPEIASPLTQQLNSVVEAIKTRFSIIRDTISTNLDDATLAVKMLEFDLQATKKERDGLQDRLDGLS